MGCILFLYLYFLIIIALKCQEDSENKAENEKNCRERNRLIGSNKSDLYTLVDATIGQKLKLQCHYCKENDDQQPKNWHKIDRLGDNFSHEVNVSMETNSRLSHFHVNAEHTLIIRNVSINDGGLYYCRGLDDQEAENKYNYFVDIVFENNSTPFEKGNLTAWKKYQHENFAPINKLFASSNGSEYAYIRNVLERHVEVVTVWESWGSCELCGRPQGQGQKRKKGLCRLKPSPLHDTITTIKANNSDENFLLNAFEISCRSLVLTRLFPGISNITKYLPHFMQIDHCQGTCNPDAEGLSKGWKTGKKKGFKYKKSFVLAENAHLTIVCPESTLDNVVVWRKQNKILERGERVASNDPNMEPRITVDTFNTLYLYGVTKEEEGNYTCQVDDIKMQQITVYVVSKSRLLTQAFVRHMMYLAFVLSLTLTCYCAGLVVTWKKRRTFKSYEDIVESKKLTEHKGSDDEATDVI